MFQLNLPLRFVFFFLFTGYSAETPDIQKMSKEKKYLNFFEEISKVVTQADINIQ